MSFCVERYLPLLEVLRKANPKLRRSIIRDSEPGLIDAISEICLNYVKGNICCSKNQYGALAKHKETLRRLSKDSGRKKRGSQRRKYERQILLQKGDGFWFALLPVVAELSAYFISKALKK